MSTPPPPPPSPAEQAAVKSIQYRSLAEAEIAKRTGASMPRADICCQLAYLYLIEAQLRADAPHVLPDPPPAAVSEA